MVPITVTPVNDAPTISQLPVTTPEDSSITICPTIADIDGDLLTVSICSAPANGTATIVGNCIVYVPNPNFNGQDSICIKVCDNGTPQLCNQVMVPITVTPVNDAPTISQLPVTTPEDSSITICPTNS